MKHQTVSGPWRVLGGCFATLAIVGCAPPKEASAPEPSPAPSAALQLSVQSQELARFEVTAATVAPLTETLHFNGTIEAHPASLARVNSRVKAKVLSLSADLGEAVRAGQVIAVVESEDLHGAQVDYRLSLKRRDLAKDHLRRRQKLAGLGELERHHLEEYQQSLSQLNGQVAEAEGLVKTARAAWEEAQSEERSLAAQREQASTRLATAQTRLQRAEALFREELLARQDLEQAQAERKQAQAEVAAAEARREQGAARVRSAQAKWEAAQGNLKSLQEQHQRAAEALAREEKVVKGGYTRGKELIEAENALQQAEIAVESARDDIELLGGQPGDMHSIPIHAPIAGRVLERHASLGETVDMDKPLYTLFNGNEVWAQLAIPPADLARVRPGQTVLLHSEAAPQQSFPATVVTLGQVTDPHTRLVTLRCRLQRPTELLRPGMFVTGELKTAESRKAVVVPESALQEKDGKSVVFVATEMPGRFVQRSIDVLARRGGKVWVRTGLKAGEKVVTHNASLLSAQQEKGS